MNLNHPLYELMILKSAILKTCLTLKGITTLILCIQRCAYKKELLDKSDRIRTVRLTHKLRNTSKTTKRYYKAENYYLHKRQTTPSSKHQQWTAKLIQCIHLLANRNFLPERCEHIRTIGPNNSLMTHAYSVTTT